MKILGLGGNQSTSEITSILAGGAPALSNDKHKEVIANVLKKTVRTQLQIRFLQSAFQKISFFQDVSTRLSAEDNLNLMRELTYESYPKGHVLFQYGDTGNKFYVIIRGKVAVLVKNAESISTVETVESLKKNNEKGSTQSALNLFSAVMNLKKSGFNNLEEDAKSGKKKFQLTMNKMILQKKIDKEKLNEFRIYNVDQIDQQINNIPLKAQQPIKKGNDHDQAEALESEKFHELISNKPQVLNFNKILMDEEYYKQYFPDMHKVNVIETGASFGEIALQNNCTRKATIICEENTEFAVLSRKSYQSILSNYMGGEQNLKRKFLHQFKIFNCFDFGNKLDTIALFLHPIEYKYNQVIYQEGNKIEYFYMLLHGDIELSRIVELEDNSEKKLISHPNKQKNNPFNSIWNRELKNLQTKRIRHKISAPNYFGEDEIINKTPVRDHQAVCKSLYAKVYYIKKEQLEKDFILKTPEFLNQLIQEFDKKKLWRSEFFDPNTGADLEQSNQNHPAFMPFQSEVDFIKEDRKILFSSFNIKANKYLQEGKESIHASQGNENESNVEQPQLAEKFTKYRSKLPNLAHREKHLSLDNSKQKFMLEDEQLYQYPKLSERDRTSSVTQLITSSKILGRTSTEPNQKHLKINLDKKKAKTISMKKSSFSNFREELGKDRFLTAQFSLRESLQSFDSNFQKQQKKWYKLSKSKKNDLVKASFDYNFPFLIKKAPSQNFLITASYQ